MVSTTTESGLTLEEVAQSAFRAHGHAAGISASAIEWDSLGPESQARYLRLAKRAEAALRGVEGQPYAEAGNRLFMISLGPDADSGSRGYLDPATRLAWEAVARHLTCLFDSEDVPNLPALEASWGSWVRGRLGLPEPPVTEE